MDVKEALGISHNQLSEFCGVPIHRELVEPLHALSQRAKGQGFDLAVASGYRSFDRQLEIWNQKASGLRPVLDDNGNALDISRLSELELVFSILRWSALPGTSRHHWGTDVDVYDEGPSKVGYQLQLTVEETFLGGAYADFYVWLNQELSRSESLFFRPYTLPTGGVAPEPWHLSYRPLAELYQTLVTKAAVLEQICCSDLQLKSVVMDHFDEIYQRFICTHDAAD